jgi:predicted metal-dependent phosphoesterase TrpH
MHSPAENVHMAESAGLEAIAITDHDTVAGIEEAMAEGKTCGIKVVPGVEISTVAYSQDIHILGYYIDYRDKDLLERLREQRELRGSRNSLILGKLAQLNMPLTMEEILAYSEEKKGEDETVGRPHIAAAMVAKGYAGSISEAFDRYLAKGAAAYVNVPRLSPKEAIRWIHEAGGTAVLAHPGLYDAPELLAELVSAGLDGIEAFHSDHTAEQEQAFVKEAERFGLIITAGSDFHGERGGEALHAPIGTRKVNAAVLKLLNRRELEHENT